MMMSATWRLKPAEGSASLGASTSSRRKLLYAAVASTLLQPQDMPKSARSSAGALSCPSASCASEF